MTVYSALYDESSSSYKYPKNQPFLLKIAESAIFYKKIVNIKILNKKSIIQIRIMVYSTSYDENSMRYRNPKNHPFLLEIADSAISYKEK